MRFTPWKCPRCGQAAAGTQETIPGLALLMFDDDGQAEYSGETTVYWNGQESCWDEFGRAILECPNGHAWSAEHEDDVCHLE